jgi:hypothetical protein
MSRPRHEWATWIALGLTLLAGGACSLNHGGLGGEGAAAGSGGRTGVIGSGGAPDPIGSGGAIGTGGIVVGSGGRGSGGRIGSGGARGSGGVLVIGSGGAMGSGGADDNGSGGAGGEGLGNPGTGGGSGGLVMGSGGSPRGSGGMVGSGGRGTGGVNSAEACRGLRGSRAFTPPAENRPHCYWFHGDALTWAMSSSTCQMEGGTLATVTSAEENAFVLSIVTTFGEEGYVSLGGTDGRPASDATGAGTYTSWAEVGPEGTHEPDGFCDTCNGMPCQCDHRLAIGPTGSWYDRWEANPRPYVCEAPAPSSGPGPGFPGR